MKEEEFFKKISKTQKTIINNNQELIEKGKILEYQFNCNKLSGIDMAVQIFKRLRKDTRVLSVG